MIIKKGKEKKKSSCLPAFEAGIKTPHLEKWLFKGKNNICPVFPGGSILYNNQMALSMGESSTSQKNDS